MLLGFNQTLSIYPPVVLQSCFHSLLFLTPATSFVNVTFLLFLVNFVLHIFRTDFDLSAGHLYIRWEHLGCNYIIPNLDLIFDF